MKPELDKQLCEKYPKIFAQRHMSPSETCMCWGLDVGDGWYDLIDNLCHEIQSHIDYSVKAHNDTIEYNKMLEAAKAGDFTEFDKFYNGCGPEWVQRRRQEVVNEQPRRVPTIVDQVEAAQVKEKFGGLRFYTDGANDYGYALISFAESMSLRICEECGAPGKPRHGGWIRTLCDNHADPKSRKR